jgi:very-short-patch-repair endonuclease
MCVVFFDILVIRADKSQWVIEIDGKHHQNLNQAGFDAFRDAVLESKGIKAVRTKAEELHRANVIRMGESSSPLASHLFCTRRRY